jgi:excinuclease ABC subunit C
MVTELIGELLRQLPNSPGVYIMRNVRGNILYVGKSNNLRNRVRSYFSSKEKLTPKTQVLVAQIHDFEYFVVTSDQEALILELNLIKRYWPPYNVLLKDDKTFPYLKLNTREDWPRLYITRKLEEDGSHYFGPFASVQSLRRTLDVLKRAFPLRSCSRPINETKAIRPCLKYDMGSCPAPCAGNINKAEYRRVINQLIKFLVGKQDLISRDIKKRMEEASEKMNYELAARLRDQIKALQEVGEGQRIAMKVRGEQDAIAFITEFDQAYVQVFMIRYGKLIGRETFILKGVSNEEPKQIMTSFIKQFYSASPHIPKIILIQHPIDDPEVIEKWLSGKKGACIKIEVPRRGKKKQLIDIVAENAKHGLDQVKIKQLSGVKELESALCEIQRELQLPQLPSRIEGYDISNIQGRDAVGSLVVFENGKPKTGDYRRFKIKTVEGANDYAMLQEVLKRRFNKINSQEGQSNSSWKLMPDLIIIDGGKGQVSAAREVLAGTGLDSLSIAGLAKKNEEIFLPGKKSPIVLSKSSLGLRLLQRLRDEAHRFAVMYFRKVHKKRSYSSILDGVPGLGPKRRKILLKHFGSVQAIRQASLEQIQKVPGINRNLAKILKDSL